MTDLEVPASLELLDVAGNGMHCERYLWIRGLSDRSLEPQARVDLLDEQQRFPGEVLFVAARDGTMAAMVRTLRATARSGATYVSLFARADPGEPALGDLVELASGRARAMGVPQVRCGGTHDRPHVTALVDRHGFVEHDTWRRFHVDTGAAPAQSRIAGRMLPHDVRIATLAARPGLAGDAFQLHRAGLEDTPGDVALPDETADGWLGDIDSSPILGRDQVLLLLDDEEHVLALVELERLAMGSEHASVEFLTVARSHRGRGLARLAKQCAVEHAREIGITRLQTMNHAENAAICALNESLGWTEDPMRVTLRRDVD